MLIYDQLKRDHEKLKSMMNRLEATTGRAVKTRMELLQELKTLLLAHTKAEEAVFYRTILSDDSTCDQALESLDEHKSAEAALAEIEDTDPKSDAWLQRFKFFKRSLEHHFEEEEKDLFKKARKIVSRDEAEELGDIFQELRIEVIEDLGT